MAMRERTKERLKWAVSNAAHRDGNLQQMAEAGPAKVVDLIVRHGRATPEAAEDANDLAINREEAEQIVASILGLC